MLKCFSCTHTPVCTCTHARAHTHTHTPQQTARKAVSDLLLGANHIKRLPFKLQFADIRPKKTKSLWVRRKKKWQLNKVPGFPIGIRLTHKCQADCNETRYYLIITEGLMSNASPQVNYTAIFFPRDAL